MISEPIVVKHWTDAALCAQGVGDTDDFFPEPGRTSHKAVKICEGCDVRAECLHEAMTAENNGADLYGVWGGMSRTSRAALRKKFVHRGKPFVPEVDTLRMLLVG